MSRPLSASTGEDVVQSESFAIDWGLPVDPMRDLYGDPKRSWALELLGSSYSVLGLSKVENPTDQEILLLPFYGEPDDPKVSDLVSDPELGNLILQAWAFDRFVTLS